MEARHQSECDNMRADLEKQLPFKVKESSEFLNLKKQEEHMAKQKLYPLLDLDIPKQTKFRSDSQIWREPRRKPGSTPAISKYRPPSIP
jgi:hypothetical protein